MVLRLSAHVLYGLDAVLDGGRHSGRQIHVFAFSEDGCEYRSKSTHTQFCALVCHTIYTICIKKYHLILICLASTLYVLLALLHFNTNSTTMNT